MTNRRSAHRDRRRGSQLIELAIVSSVLFLVICAVFEFARMALVYSSIANAARVGARYASVNGADKGGGATLNQICNVVTSYTAGLKTSSLTCGGSSGSRIAVAWPDGNAQPGSRVQVTVVYRYDPFFTSLPLGVLLGSTTEAYIMY